MFLGDRKQIIQTFILNDDPAIREKQLLTCLRHRLVTSLACLRQGTVWPVIVRLLDPPLHEFLESPRALDVEIARLEATGADAEEIAVKRTLMEQIDGFAEQNPMLGLRGVRLAIKVPILPVMQIRCNCYGSGTVKESKVLILSQRFMIPLVSVKT